MFDPDWTLFFCTLPSVARISLGNLETALNNPKSKSSNSSRYFVDACVCVFVCVVFFSVVREILDEFRFLKTLSKSLLEYHNLPLSRR